MAQAARTLSATLENLHACNVRQMVRSPWRIAEVVYPAIPPSWPPANGRSPTEVLSDCRCRIRELRAAEGALCRIVGLTP